MAEPLDGPERLEYLKHRRHSSQLRASGHFGHAGNSHGRDPQRHEAACGRCELHV